MHQGCYVNLHVHYPKGGLLPIPIESSLLAKVPSRGPGELCGMYHRALLKVDHSLDTLTHQK